MAHFSVFAVLLVLLNFRALAIELPYQTCAENYCTGLGEDGSSSCIKSENCKMFVTMETTNTSWLRIRAYLTDVKPDSSNWFAVGFSDDDKMGDDSVVECHLLNDKLTQHISLNKKQRNIVADDSSKVTGFQLGPTRIDLSTTECEWFLAAQSSVKLIEMRKNKPKLHAKDMDLIAKQYRVLLAYGTLDEKGIKQQHLPQSRIAGPKTHEYQALTTASSNMGESLPPGALIARNREVTVTLTMRQTIWMIGVGVMFAFAAFLAAVIFVVNPGRHQKVRTSTVRNSQQLQKSKEQSKDGSKESSKKEKRPAPAPFVDTPTAMNDLTVHTIVSTDTPEKSKSDPTIKAVSVKEPAAPVTAKNPSVIAEKAPNVENTVEKIPSTKLPKKGSNTSVESDKNVVHKPQSVIEKAPSTVSKNTAMSNLFSTGVGISSKHTAMSNLFSTGVPSTQTESTYSFL